MSDPEEFAFSQLSKKAQQQIDQMSVGFGFRPNGMIEMAKWPELLEAFSNLCMVTFSGSLDIKLRVLSGLLASSVGGCRYCQAHTAFSANKLEIPVEKIQAVFEYESNEQFSLAEVAAFRFVHHSALNPNAVTADDVKALNEHFNSQQIIELQAISSMYAWINRFNDSFSVTLEDGPRQFAEKNLSQQGWIVGKHG